LGAGPVGSERVNGVHASRLEGESPYRSTGGERGKG
jgi:hypothetical protein